MAELITFFGVFLVIEGVFYAGAPSVAKRIAAELIEMDESTLRIGGIVALMVGVGIVWLVRG